MSKPKAKPIPYLFAVRDPPPVERSQSLRAYGSGFLEFFWNPPSPFSWTIFLACRFLDFLGSFRLGGLFRPDPEVAPYSGGGVKMDDDDFGEDQ
jgi:hypothetical protein